jgi:carbonic anhydrase
MSARITEGIMTTRRGFLAATALLTTGATIARAQDSCAVFTKDTQSATSAEQALARLKEGNARFLDGRTIHCDLRAQVKGTAGGQAPFAAILGCMDSRVPPELVFDQRIGDIFAVRIAGNFVNKDILGSLEYATQVAGAKLIVVLGHTDCGAVKGAVDDVKLGNLTATLASIRPAVLEVTGVEGERNSKNKKFVQSVADRNARDAAAMLTARSSVMAALVEEHKLKIVSAMHDVRTGAVGWFTAPNDRHRQARRTDQLSGFVDDVDGPNLGAATQMHRTCGAGDESAACRPQVIGVDLLSHALVFVGIDAHHRAGAAQGFCKRHGSAAVKQSIGLPGPAVDGHGGANEVLADFNEFDSEVLDQRAIAGIQFLHREQAAPYAHSGSLSWAATRR